MWFMLAATIASSAGKMNASKAQATIESGMLRVKAIELETQKIAAESNSMLAAKRAKITAEDAKIARRNAKLQGQLDAIGLRSNFNRTMASNAVIAAAQGRSGGSVQQVFDAAEEAFNWDLELSKLNQEIVGAELSKGTYINNSEAFNYQMQALGLESAAAATASSAAYTLSSGKRAAESQFFSDVGMKLASSGAGEAIGSKFGSLFKTKSGGTK